MSQRSGSNLGRVRGIALILGLTCHAGNLPTDYPQMAALDQYLISDPDAEIAMARSAAPETISRRATVLILKRTGYQAAINGSNGFTCLVERSWMSPFDSPGFWNPRIRGPICYNPPAVRTILPYTLIRTKLFLNGSSKTEAHAVITSSVAKNELPLPAAGAMSYMLSKAGYLGDDAGHWRPHLMFHVPRTDEANWGANVPGSPVLFDSDSRDVPEPETIFMVAVSHWSDGSAASRMDPH